MINRITLLIAMVLFTSCATPPRITYEGERNQEEKYHGEGVITYSNGEKWEGEFKDDKRNGQGTLTLPNGEKYVGEFKDGLQNGKGVFYRVNGEILSGTIHFKRIGLLKP